MILIAILAIPAANPAAWAGDGFLPGSRYTSGRGAALGDAFIPLADDGASGLFYNPAGLGKIKYKHLEPLNIQLSTNTGYLGMFDRTFYKVTSLQDFAPTLIRKDGQAASAMASVFPNFYLRGIGFGVLMQNRIHAVNEGGNIHYRSLYQLIPTVGGAIRLASGVVRIGYSLQWVNQTSGDVTVPNTDANLSFKNGLASGSALSHNAGIALTLPVQYLPSFNFVARNILGAKYKSFNLISAYAKNSPGVPVDDPMTFDGGFSISPKVGMGAVVNISLVERDLTNRSGTSILKRFAGGMEFAFRDSFFVRGGYGSMYPSAGIGLKRKTAEFSLTWYAEDLGTAAQSLRDTRFLLQYQIRAF